MRNALAGPAGLPTRARPPGRAGVAPARIPGADQEVRRTRALSEGGVTLIELMVAITLVAALAAGMLMAMRAGLITLDKTDARLDSNRRVMGARRILLDELGGVMPVTGTCAGGARVSAFNGNSKTLHMVSSYSLAEGARGTPHVLEFQVVASDEGSVRLIVNESLYAGPSSITPFCSNGVFTEGQQRADSFVLADHLAYCRFEYRAKNAESLLPENWIPEWTKPDLPATVRIDMAQASPGSASLPLLSVTLPIHVTRDVFGVYLDGPQ